MKVSLISNINKSDHHIYKKFEAFVTWRDLEIYPNNIAIYVAMRKLIFN